MRSLRARLLALWARTLAASVAVGALLVDISGQTTDARVGQAEAVVARACDLIRDRFSFYATNWSGPVALDDAALRRDLTTLTSVALARQSGVEGGLWQADAGRLAYTYPTYPGGVKTDLSDAERERIQALNEQVGRDEQAGSARVTLDRQTLLLHACAVAGPIPQLTAWAMTRVSANTASDGLRLGLGTLFALMLGISGWLAWLLLLGARRVAQVEAALAGHSAAAPHLAPTGEPDLDRIVAALNQAGARLTEARGRVEALTVRVAASERLAALGRVAAGVAHELRNPVGAMRLRAENALAVDDPARRMAALRAVLEQLGRLDRLSDGLLAMMRPRTPRRHDTDLATIVGACVAMFSPRAERAGVALAASGEGRAALDPDLVRSALEPLVDNANRHARGAVRVTGGIESSVVRFVVEDDGPGVDPALAETLFDPFVTGRPEGTGLGLAIARGAAAAHGGRLWLDTTATGARFVLEFQEAAPSPPS